jgi:hypothetical protein
VASKREWTVPEFPDENIQPVDREEAVAAFMEAEAILHRMGGAMMIAARRVETPDGRFFTAGYAFRHESFAPATRQQSDDLVEPVPLDEPLEEEFEQLQAEPVETGG